jgi:transposase
MERTPMSHAGTIIGIPGLQIEQVKRSQGIDVWARHYDRPPESIATALI